MIFTTGGIKGGSGKTSLAVSLAVLLAKSQNDVLLVAVLSIDPMVPSIILFLNQKASHPDILGYPALPVKSVLLLPDVYRTLCLLEKSESPQRNGVIWWDLYVPSLLLLCLLGSRLDDLRRVDWACHKTAVLLERVDEDS